MEKSGFGMDIVAEDRKSARKTVAAAILLVCFAVRIAWIVHSIGRPFYADESIYDDIARNILNGQGFSRGNPPHPSAFTMPIMPYLVAVVYALSGYSVLAVRILLAALDTLTCFLLMSLGYSLFRRWRIALLAGIIFSLHPLFIHLSSKLFSDTLLTLLIVSSLTSLLAAHRRDSVKLTALSGLLMALSILTRPTTVLLPAVVAGLLFCARKPGRRWMPSIASYLLIVFLLVIPWTIRNGLVFHRFIPLHTRGGENLYVGAGPGAHGETVTSVGTQGAPSELAMRIRYLSEPAASDVLMKEATKLIKNHPVHWMRLGVEKFLRLWFRLYRPRAKSLLGLILFLANVVLLAATFVGAKRSPDKLAGTLVFWIFGYFSFFHMVVCSELRYSAPAYAFFIPFAAAALLFKGATGDKT